MTPTSGNGEIWDVIGRIVGDDQAHLTPQQRDTLFLAGLKDIRQKLSTLPTKDDFERLTKKVEENECNIEELDDRLDEAERKYNFWSGLNTAIATLGTAFATAFNRLQ